MTAITSLKNQVSPEEWQLRVDLAAAYRLVALYGWDDLVFTHISARVPGPEHHFLINPYGMMFEEITASSLVKIDLNGEKVEDSPYPVNPAGFTIHSAIHQAREDAHCVMHTHSLNGVAVSAQRDGVLPLSQQATLILANLADNTFLMLRNHGLLTVGNNPADAFLAMYIFEATCMIQVRALAGNRELTPINPAIVDGVKEAARIVTKGMFGGLAWPGLLRKLDRQNPGYTE